MYRLSPKATTQIEIRNHFALFLFGLFPRVGGGPGQGAIKFPHFCNLTPLPRKRVAEDDRMTGCFCSFCSILLEGFINTDGLDHLI
ncbi:hypothetical protein BDP81DRAFT_440738 [Colletotrichum phormii]|uniref:Uncharacterized protein n=1 Tax=Colletotrichum phormii TaxID=359342 RepID=A0AAI9ZDW5_9PEZI|nr:uncharacterized protein BDP81DRAFT_440738 [Colletotrichum phormii]KAK1622744.1 hypothetical protein BDP81DRAFT_440738 [Colletotrichum phormii]